MKQGTNYVQQVFTSFTSDRVSLINSRKSCIKGACAANPAANLELRQGSVIDYVLSLVLA